MQYLACTIFWNEMAEGRWLYVTHRRTKIVVSQNSSGVCILHVLTITRKTLIYFESFLISGSCWCCLALVQQVKHISLLNFWNRPERQSEVKLGTPIFVFSMTFSLEWLACKIVLLIGGFLMDLTSRLNIGLGLDGWYLKLRRRFSWVWNNKIWQESGAIFATLQIFHIGESDISVNSVDPELCRWLLGWLSFGVYVILDPNNYSCWLLKKLDP